MAARRLLVEIVGSGCRGESLIIFKFERLQNVLEFNLSMALMTHSLKYFPLTCFYATLLHSNADLRKLWSILVGFFATFTPFYGGSDEGVYKRAP